MATINAEQIDIDIWQIVNISRNAEQIVRYMATINAERIVIYMGK